MKKILSILAAFLVPFAVSAQETITLQNPLNANSVPELIANILRAAIGIVGALALLVFIYGGFIWLTSGGEAGKVSAGKEAMKWAAIGLVVIFTSYGLVRFVFSAITG
ncbi:MAG: pilin [Patescibacteria group bacterium]|nr:MAG: pilin [Patescibacteria group bacterium]